MTNNYEEVRKRQYRFQYTYAALCLLQCAIAGYQNYFCGRISGIVVVCLVYGFVVYARNMGRSEVLLDLYKGLGE